MNFWSSWTTNQYSVSTIQETLSSLDRTVLNTLESNVKAVINSDRVPCFNELICLIFNYVCVAVRG